MALRTIVWNRLYSAQRFKQAEVLARIQSHYDRKKLEKKGITFADVRYVPIRLTCPRY